jgi:hypothetical protein
MDRLTKQARQHAERHSERKAFNDQTAMSQALQRAREARQPNVSAKPNEASHGPHTTADTPIGGDKSLEPQALDRLSESLYA